MCLQRPGARELGTEKGRGEVEAEVAAFLLHRQEAESD